jgi:hypothetical protein
VNKAADQDPLPIVPPAEALPSNSPAVSRVRENRRDGGDYCGFDSRADSVFDRRSPTPNVSCHRCCAFHLDIGNDERIDLGMLGEYLGVERADPTCTEQSESDRAPRETLDASGGKRGHLAGSWPGCQRQRTVLDHYFPPVRAIPSTNWRCKRMKIRIIGQVASNVPAISTG